MIASTLRVFVSSTSDDLTRHRAAVREIIPRHGWQPVGMEDFGSRSDRTVAFCREAVAGCQLVVAVITFPRGWVPGEAEGGDPKALLLPAPEDMLRVGPVSREVDTPRNNGPDLLAPLVDADGDS